MLHYTKNKGDIAATKAIADLTTKGYSVFTPVVCEHLAFDLIAYQDGKCYRVQAKYAAGKAYGIEKPPRGYWVKKTYPLEEAGEAR